MKRDVVIRPCAEYSEAWVQKAVDESVGELGGWGAFVARGTRVLVKVNMLSDHAPEDAVTTHPEVVRAVVRGLKGAGAKVMVGDSPASASGVKRVWEKTGIRAVCEEEGVPLVTFEGETPREVKRDGYDFVLSSVLQEVDAVVNLPKVKTHALMTFTCGVKNLYGLVPGYFKATLHKRYPSTRAFAGLLRAIEAEVKPVLTLADGVVGMEGEGPSNGTPVKLGFVAASADPYRLDCAVATLLGIPLRSIPYLAHLAKECEAESVLPEEAKGLRPVSYKIPSTAQTRLIPTWLVRWISPLVWVRPEIDETKCVRCGKCVASCPVKTLQMAKSVPVLSNPGACIGCCCCHEMCPKGAIEMRQSWLLRLYGAYKDLK